MRSKWIFSIGLFCGILLGCYAFWPKTPEAKLKGLTRDMIAAFNQPSGSNLFAPMATVVEVKERSIEKKLLRAAFAQQIMDLEAGTEWRYRARVIPGKWTFEFPPEQPSLGIVGLELELFKREQSGKEESIWRIQLRLSFREKDSKWQLSKCDWEDLEGQNPFRK